MELFIILVLTTIALAISIMSIMGIIKSKELDSKIIYTLFIVYKFGEKTIRVNGSRNKTT